MTEVLDVVRSRYQVSASDFPADGSYTQQWAFLLRYVILAPSTFNTQPWKFQMSVDEIAVYADYTRRMPIADPGNREMLMSIGAAIMNLRVAAAHFDIGCEILYNTSGTSEEPIAFARLTPCASLDADAQRRAALLPWIPKRHTNRSPFLMSRVPNAVVSQVLDATRRIGGSLFMSVDGSLNERIADLVAQADQAQLNDPNYRQDLAQWMRSQWTQTNDGVPGEALGLDERLSMLTAWTTKVLDAGKLRAARDRNLCLDAPGIIGVCGEDTVEGWLTAGELLEETLLLLTREGVHHSYFNMPVHLPELRAELKRILNVREWPQLLLRVGYSLSEPFLTPRRPVEEVLLPPTIPS